MTTPSPGLRRCLGPVAVTAQSVGTIGLTLTAVINIPQVAAGAGSATWLCYVVAFGAILLVSETLVLFHRQPAGASGIAAYVGTGLGSVAGDLAAWALLLGYGATLVAALAYFGSYLDHLVTAVGLPSLPAVTFLIGGLACVELTRRDVRLSTTAMLCTESISVLIVLGLCVAVLRHGGEAADLAALTPVGDLPLQIRSGLMVAVLSFIGFESAATLGEESLRPERAVPRALRLAVLVAGGLFLFWSVVLTEGLSWLPVGERTGLDPISLLADQLGRPGAGDWIRVGAFLCLFGSCLGSLTALGRVTFGLAETRVLPARLARVDDRFRTPAMALQAAASPAIVVGTVAVLRGLDARALFDLFGALSVLGFLPVYALVAAASLRRPLPGMGCLRRRLVGGTTLVAVLIVGGGFVWSLVGHQNGLLLSFVLLLAIGALLVARREHRGR